MARFLVRAADAAGGRREFWREATSRAVLDAELRTEGLLPLSVDELPDPNALPPRWHPAWLVPMTSFVVEIGFRQLSSMLKSALPAVAALETVSEQGRNVSSRAVWRRVRDHVLSGVSVADAFDAERRYFGELSVRLAAVGERSGELDKCLLRAADQLESRRNLRTTTINAFLYPALAVLVTIGVSVFLVTAVIPKIADFLVSSGAELPGMTKMLVDVSAWTMANAVPLVLAPVVVAALWLVVRTSAKGAELEDALLLKLPVSGSILRLSATASFARAMQLMCESALPLVDALGVASKLSSNRRLRRRIEVVRDMVLRGTTVSDALATAKEFPPMLARMASVGERTGSLGESFGETARYHEMMLGVAVKRFGTLIEPALICVTGLIVGFVYIAFFMAIFALAGAAG